MIGTFINKVAVVKIFFALIFISFVIYPSMGMSSEYSTAPLSKKEDKLAKEREPFCASEVVSELVIGVTPGISWCKCVYEAVSGKKLVSGKNLTKFEHRLAIVQAVAGGHGLGVGAVCSSLEAAKYVDESIRERKT